MKGVEKETTKSANAPYYVLHIAWNHAFSRRSRAVTAKKSTKKRDALNVGLRKAELDSTLRVQHRATLALTFRLLGYPYQGSVERRPATKEIMRTYPSVFSLISVLM